MFCIVSCSVELYWYTVHVHAELTDDTVATSHGKLHTISNVGCNRHLAREGGGSGTQWDIKDLVMQDNGVNHPWRLLWPLT